MSTKGKTTSKKPYPSTLDLGIVCLKNSYFITLDKLEPDPVLEGFFRINPDTYAVLMEKIKGRAFTTDFTPPTIRDEDGSLKAVYDLRMKPLPGKIQKATARRPSC